MECNFPTAEAIEKIEELVKPQIHELTDVNGRKSQFATAGLIEITAKAPEQKPGVQVYTMDALRDLITQGFEGVPFSEKAFLHISSETKVRLLDKVSDGYGRRQCYAVAEPVPFEKFPFERWMDQESFAIGIASKFMDGFDKDYVLKLAAEIQAEATGTSNDNGFTQTVSTKAGIAHKIVQEVKPRVVLAPYRIFPELTQPESHFVLRARVMDNKEPALCLYEADGGVWKIRAIEIIRKRLESYDLGVSVIA